MSKQKLTFKIEQVHFKDHKQISVDVMIFADPPEWNKETMFAIAERLQSLPPEYRQRPIGYDCTDFPKVRISLGLEKKPGETFSSDEQFAYTVAIASMLQKEDE